MSAAPHQEVVGPLTRGLAVLRTLSDPDCPRTSPGTLAKATGLARSTVDRVISTLVALDCLRSDGREVQLAPRLAELGNAYLSSVQLPRVFAPYVTSLADELDESVSVAVPDGTGVRTIAQATRRRPMSLAFRIGDLLPGRPAPTGLFSSEGSESPEWALDDQSIEPGLITVAVPVRDPEGKTVCAMSVVSHTSRHSVDSLADHVLPRLRATAAEAETVYTTRLTRLRLRRGSGTTVGTGTAAELVRSCKRTLGTGFLQSLARGLSVITAFDADHDMLTLSEVSQVTGLPRATVRRSLLTLEQLGYVASHDRYFKLLPRVLELGYAPLSQLSLEDVVTPHLAALGEQVRESASVCVLDGDDVRYVARVPTVRIMSVNITVGTKFPAYATSMGRVLLAGLPPQEQRAALERITPQPLTPRTLTTAEELRAELDRVGGQGYALVDEELELGLRSVAAPIRDRAGRVIAAVNISTHAGALSLEETEGKLLQPLLATAARIEADLRALDPGF